MSDRILKITDGTSTVNLLSLDDGYSVDGWQQQIARYKGGGAWSQSALSDGRRLVDYRYANVHEVMPLAVTGGEADNTFRALADIVLLLTKAADYWRDTWRGEPVWLERRMDGETNTSYAIIHAGHIPNLPDLLHGPWTQDPVAFDLELNVEHGHWTSDPPESATCVEISGYMNEGISVDRYWEPTESADDGRANSAGGWNNAAHYVWFGDSGGEDQDAGIRFRNVNIPRGAEIITAWLRFEAHSNRNAAVCNVQIYGEDDSVPAQWATAADYYARPRTTASVLWNAIPAWVANTIYTSPVITTIIQEIVDRDDWASGNNMSIFIQNNASTAGALREASAEDDPADDPPQLWVEYIEPRGRVIATCDEEVYVQNKHNKAQLTHIYQDDGGAWSGNLLAAALPYWLMPAATQPNDSVYFGIETSYADTGPFNNLVFDISSAATYTNGTWEYWDGAAWSSVGMFVQDNTDMLRNTGVNSWHWRPHADWAPVDLNVAEGGAAPAVTAWWVRYDMTGVAGAGAQQQNRHPYTVTWPYIEVASDDIGGHIDALSLVTVANQSAGGAGVPFLISRTIAGLRSTSRGDLFTAYLNAADEQNPDGLTVTVDAGTCAMVDNILPSTGRSVQWNPAGVLADTLLYHYSFTPALARQFFGRYHAYLRVSQVGGTDGDFSFYVVFTFGDRAFEMWRSPEVTCILQNAANASLVDLGVVDFYSDVFRDDEEIADVLIDVYGSNASVGADGDIFFLELILMPVDECAFDANPGRAEDLATILDYDIYSSRWLETRAEIDGITNPKRYIRSHVKDANDYVKARWRTVATGPPILHPNTDQRWWFLFTAYHQPFADFVEECYPHCGATVQFNAARQYLLGRGDS